MDTPTPALNSALRALGNELRAHFSVEQTVLRARDFLWSPFNGTSEIELPPIGQSATADLVRFFLFLV